MIIIIFLIIMIVHKVTFCREHLALQQVLAPGLSEYRAYISSHLVEPLYLLAKKR